MEWKKCVRWNGKNFFTTSNQVEKTLKDSGIPLSRSTIKRRLHEWKYREFRFRLCQKHIKECWKKIFRQMSARLDCTRLTRREMYGAWWESAMVWVCIVVSGTRSAVLTHYVTADRSARVNSEVYWAVLCAQIQPCFAKLTEKCFTVLMDKDPTQSKRKDILFNDQTNHLSMISSYRYCRLNWRQSIWQKETYTIRWWF